MNDISRDLLIAEAKRRGWKAEFISPKGFIYKITHPDGRSEIFQGSRPSRSAANGWAISKHKSLTLMFVESLGYRVSPFIVADEHANTSRFLEEHKPIVAKPNDAEQSKGVTVDIQDTKQLAAAIADAQSYSPAKKAILQKQLHGKLYRLLVINDKFVAAVHRKGAEVVGDGISTVQELIEKINSDPRRSTESSSVLKKIDISVVRSNLGESVLGEVLDAGKTLKVSSIESVSAGGEATDVTAQVNPMWQQVAIKIAHESGLFICGLDIICEDISKPPSRDTLPILEINSAPGFKMHYHPTGGGEPIEVAKVLLDELFNN